MIVETSASFTADADIPAHTIVHHDVNTPNSDSTVTPSSDSSDIIGVTGDGGIPAGGYGVVHFGGVRKVRALSAITRGDRLQAGNGGRVSAFAGGVRSVGVALDAAAAGDTLRAVIAVT